MSSNILEQSLFLSLSKLSTAKSLFVVLSPTPCGDDGSNVKSNQEIKRAKKREYSQNLNGEENIAISKGSSEKRIINGMFLVFLKNNPFKQKEAMIGYQRIFFRIDSNITPM